MVITNFEIVKEKEMPLLERKRLIISVESSDATPSNKEIRESIAKKLDIAQELIAIRHIYQHFGVRSTRVIVHVYKTKEMLKRLEKEKDKKQMEEQRKGVKKEEKK
ncbi:hypothetical protein HZB88_01515 [archaeon]|nr:hypothetical protein [archaeon]